LTGYAIVVLRVNKPSTCQSTDDFGQAAIADFTTELLLATKMRLKRTNNVGNPNALRTIAARMHAICYPLCNDIENPRSSALISRSGRLSLRNTQYAIRDTRYE
jgi:hypothetical protein